MGPVATPRVLESTFVVGKMMNAPQGPQEVFRKGQLLESPRVPMPRGGGRPLSSGRQLPPPNWLLAALGGGGGMGGGSKRGEWGGGV